MKTTFFNALSAILIFLTSSSYGEEQIKPELYVFVGQKIEVVEFQPEEEEGWISWDYAFKAKYKVLENVYGDLKVDTIEFTAYDHYGIPPFSEYEYVLLYLAKHDGEFYHEKYLFSPLYKTKDNQWAGIYSSDYLHPYNKNTKIRPEKIDFEPDVVRDIGEIIEKYSDDEIKEWFPEPYFRIEGNKAIAEYGNYIPELIQLKKDSVLKARGWKFD